MKHFPQITMYVVVRLFYICICIIHILSCFVFLVSRAFLTRASGLEDCANTSTLNKLFYSILLYKGTFLGTPFVCEWGWTHLVFSNCDQEKKASIERFKIESIRIKKKIFLEIASGACSWYRLSENHFENQSSRS